MRCRHCAHEILGPGPHQFCSSCGHAVEEVSTSDVAPEPGPTGASSLESLPEYGDAGGRARQPARRTRVGIAVGAVGAVLLVVIGLVAVRGFQGTTAGASSPDDLVSQLTSAIEKKDPAAAIALLDPKELPELGRFYETSVDTAIKNASGDDTADVDQLRDAIDLDVGGLEYSTTYLDSDHDFAKIGFSSGTISWAGHPEKLPEWARMSLDSDAASDSGAEYLADARVEDERGYPIDPFFMAVRDNGRWYISVTMTLGEYLVETTGAPAGDFDSPPEPGAPAASPREAVQTLLESAGDALSFRDDKGPGLIGLLPENETRAFRIYRRALQGNLEQSETYGVDPEGNSIPSADPDEDFPDDFGSPCDDCGVSIEKLDVSTRQQGDLTYAVLDSFTASTTTENCSSSWNMGSEEWDDSDDSSDSTSDFGPAPGDQPDCTTEHGTITWDGHCLSSTGYNDVFGYGTEYSDEGYSSEQDPGFDSEGPPDADQAFDDRACLDDEFGADGLTLADFGIVDAHVVVSQERGGWVVDPVATILDYGRTAISHLNDPEVQHALDN